MAKRKPFSWEEEGPLVESMYLQDRMSITAIAKSLHRATSTIKNYLETKKLYRGRANKNYTVGIVPEQHEEGQVYYCSRFGTYATFKKYHKDGACQIWLSNPDFLHYAYCKKTELTQI